MTGFGNAERNGYRVEIRSLNHRFLDVYIKAPGYLNQFEFDFRKIIKERFSRGKFDINIVVSEQEHADFSIHTEYAGKIYTAFKRMQDSMSIPGEFDINSLVYFREMFIESRDTCDIDLLNDVFREAVEDIYAMRIREGAALAEEIRTYTDSLLALNEQIKQQSSTVVSGVMEKFNEKISVLLDGKEIDENRILQEAALFAAKLDISEEVLRITSHLGQFREILAGGDLVGRKLDFILQELNREVNTISSKTSSFDISSLTVEMKAAIEKMREQVQNIQ
jgi:uncharacterized protein (TIGR00255 family)